jgi:oxalate decarboxylase
MSHFQRREFLTGVAALAGATAGALAAGGTANAGDPSFMNNVPDPLLTGDELPTFKFALEKLKGRVIGNSWVKEVTAAQFPISKGIAGGSMQIEPGGMRELHWHMNAAEWAYVDQGRVRTTVIDPDGNAEVNDFEPGDVWYFPRGHGHMLECLGNEPCHFVIVFDNGNFSKFSTFNLSDWIAHTPKPLLAKTFGLPEAALADLPQKLLYFAKGKIPPEKPPIPLQGEKRPRETHKGQLLAQKLHVDNKGGKLWVLDANTFPISKTISGAVLDLEPGALREPHWHPDADEWHYVLKGKVNVTMFSPPGRSRVETLEVGDVGYIPQSFGHAIENVGDERCRLLVAFNSGYVKSIGLSQWFAGNPVDVLATNLGQPAALCEKMPRKARVIVDKNGSDS